MNYAHPRKLHDRYNVHDEFRRISSHHHTSIASTRQQQASWKYARIFRNLLHTASRLLLRSRSRKVWTLYSSHRRTATTLQTWKWPQMLYLPCQVKWIYGSTCLRTQLGQALGAHRGPVEFSTNISTKQILDALNLNVSGMWLSNSKATRPCRVRGCVCLLCFCATVSFVCCVLPQSDYLRWCAFSCYDVFARI